MKLFLLLDRRGINKEWIKDAVMNPEQVVDGYGGRKVAHKKLFIDNKEYLLRVIYEETEEIYIIVAIEILDAGKRTTRNPLDLIDLSIVKEKAVA